MVNNVLLKGFHDYTLEVDIMDDSLIIA